MTSIEHCDLLICARWVVPVEPHGVVLENHAVAVRDGVIVALLPQSEARTRFAPRECVDLPDSVLIPGLINAHTHNPMTLMRGVADDLPLMQWLSGHIWPIEAAILGADYCADGAELAVAEMLRGGTTCCNENYFYPDVLGEVYRRLGFRCRLGLPIIEFPTPWAANPDEYFGKALDVHAHFAGDDLISTAFAPHAPYTVSDASFLRIRELAAELDISVHCHVHETAQEVEDSLQQHGLRPLARLDRLGVVDSRLIAVHMTQLTDEEIALCAERGVSVVHCPESNLKLASGLAPIQALRRAGVNVALGTDGCASNNDLDMFGEMRTAALLGKAVARDASALDAATTLRMATLDAARALHLEHAIGSIEAGKQADLVAVDLSALETQPLYDPISHLVYACGRHQVHWVWIAGHARLRERELTGIDLQSLLARVRAWGERIAALPRGTA
ncbi:MAG: TRZ/ATZ family hydrolase [Xanthomonadales bacterium]|nr:TRZ/ATZ family hydrolase [Xanthomonadales bacterium]